MSTYVKVNLQTSTAERVPVPACLKGLKRESLADLSWTDPSLELHGYAWWPELDQSPPLDEYQRYGAETLTLDTVKQCVLVVRDVVDWTQDEIDAHIDQMRKQQSLTARQTRLALHSIGKLADVPSAIAALPEPQRINAEIQWEYATYIERTNPFVSVLAGALQLTNEQLDQLFIDGATL